MEEKDPKGKEKKSIEGLSGADEFEKLSMKDHTSNVDQSGDRTITFKVGVVGKVVSPLVNSCYSNA